MNIKLETFRPHESFAGLVRNLPKRTYLEAPGVSKSQLDLLRVSPETLRDYLDGKFQIETTEAMEYGSITHAMSLENKRLFVVRPETLNGKKWTGKGACKKWVEEQTLTVLSPTEATSLERLCAAVRNDQLASELLKEGEAENSLFAQDPESGLMLKGRADWMGSDYFVDLKTTTDASTDEFSKEIYYRRYHVQAALYLRIAAALGLPQKRWFFIIAQKGNPPRINVRELHEEDIKLGGWELDDDLRLLQECQESRNWYGFSGKSGKIEKIMIPENLRARYLAKESELIMGGSKINW